MPRKSLRDRIKELMDKRRRPDDPDNPDPDLGGGGRRRREDRKVKRQEFFKGLSLKGKLRNLIIIALGIAGTAFYLWGEKSMTKWAIVLVAAIIALFLFIKFG